MPPLNNIRHERFCLELMTGCSQREAAMRAGYTPHDGGGFTNRLMKKPDVQTRLKELQTAAASARVMSVVERKERLSEIGREKEDVKPSDAISAIAELNKMESVYTPAKPEAPTIVIKTIEARLSE